jgi:NADH-quinone oxidoreductase subunit K
VSVLFSLFIIAAILLLAIGIYSLVVTRNLMRILLSLEILTKAVTLLMIGVGYMTGKLAEAQTYVITIIIIEVMLLVISTGILFGVYKANGSLDTKSLNNLKG